MCEGVGLSLKSTLLDFTQEQGVTSDTIVDCNCGLSSPAAQTVPGAAGRTSLPLRRVSGLKFLRSPSDWPLKFLRGGNKLGAVRRLTHSGPHSPQSQSAGVLLSHASG